MRQPAAYRRQSRREWYVRLTRRLAFNLPTGLCRRYQLNADLSLPIFLGKVAKMMKGAVMRLPEPSSMPTRSRDGYGSTGNGASVHLFVCGATGIPVTLADVTAYSLCCAPRWCGEECTLPVRATSRGSPCTEASSEDASMKSAILIAGLAAALIIAEPAVSATGQLDTFSASSASIVAGQTVDCLLQHQHRQLFQRR